MSHRKGESWNDVVRAIETQDAGPDLEEMIDALAADAIESPSPDQVDALLAASGLATRPLTQRSLALALAVASEPSNPRVVDALAEQFRAVQQDVFLGPAILDALFLLACRDPLARTELAGILYRISKHENRFLVGRAAEICGLLLQQGWCTELRTKLQEFSDSPDVLAASEAQFHLACVELADIRQADDRSSVLDALRRACSSFRGVEIAEESRPDAQVISQLVTLFLVISEQSDEVEINRRISEIRTACDGLPSWPGYESPAYSIFLSHADRTIEALVDAHRTASEACRWLDIRTALLRLSETMAVLANCSLGTLFASLGAAVSQLTGISISPKIGSVLAREIGKERIAAAIQDAECNDQESVAALTALAELLNLAESDRSLISESARFQLAELGRVTGQAPEKILSGLNNALQDGNVGPWVESLIPGRVLLPVYLAEPYGADPTVHCATVAVLEQLRKTLVNYDSSCWRHLVKVVEAILQTAHRIRDDLPDYCLCQLDGGKGQTASEADLQNDVFNDLRRRFGNRCTYERTRIAGGRSDSGVRFEEAEFPIEVKHEFQHVTRDHIRNNYLGQAADYAGSRQRVSFLLILDLRASNAAGHKDNLKKSKKGTPSIQETSLYTLKESFWCESLPVDATIANAQPNVIVVGMFPGNRPRPSSRTGYSERPRTARAKKT